MTSSTARKRRKKGASLSEFDLIAQIGRLGPGHGGQVVLGIGDDAALLRPRPGYDLAICADALVEGIHFRRKWSAPVQIGWKALAVNLSDLAAMGARPIACLSSIAAPPSWSAKEILEIHRGIVRCGKKYGSPLVGGNCSRAPRGSAFEIHVTAVGEVPRGKALLRSGARAGDDVWVSGLVGEGARGLAVLQRGRPRDPSERRAVRRYLAPDPRVGLGLALQMTGKVRAAIDISDGLLADLGHVLESSGGLGAVLESKALPLAVPGGIRLALSGGDDYELLFCAPPSARSAILKAARAAGVRVSRIGRIEKKSGLHLQLPGGRIVPY
ncbi:MAG: thiamine-phosphate kinase, partial [Bdellovibrionota bacterium]